METVGFVQMASGTREDYELLGRLEKEWVSDNARRVLAHLELLRGSYGGYQVDRFEHSLQTATRAQRDGASEEMVVAALLHDIGDVLSPCNHSDFGAALLKPYVSEETYWVVRHHGVFQGYYYFHHFGGDRNLRDRYSDSPHFQACIDFCERWDQAAFDPAYQSQPLSHFEPMVARLFAREPFHPDMT